MYYINYGYLTGGNNQLLLPDSWFRVVYYTVNSLLMERTRPG
jgi:hypothetical protein